MSRVIADVADADFGRSRRRTALSAGGGKKGAKKNAILRGGKRGTRKGGRAKPSSASARTPPAASAASLPGDMASNRIQGTRSTSASCIAAAISSCDIGLSFRLRRTSNNSIIRVSIASGSLRVTITRGFVEVMFDPCADM